MLNDTFAKRFMELDAAFDKMPFENRDGYRNTSVRNGFWRKWATSRLLKYPPVMSKA